MEFDRVESVGVLLMTKVCQSLCRMRVVHLKRNMQRHFRTQKHLLLPFDALLFEHDCQVISYDYLSSAYQQ